jgi:hypothetical protein
MNDMFSTMIKLVKAEWSSIEDYVWYRFAIGAHKYEKKKIMMILFKEGLL